MYKIHDILSKILYVAAVGKHEALEADEECGYLGKGG